MRVKLVFYGMFGILFVTSSCLSDAPAQTVTPVSACIRRAVSSNEVIERKLLDLNEDGELDEVALVQNDDLHILASLGATTPTCELVLDEALAHLLLRDGRQTIEANAIETVEVTGERPSELYIWVDEEGRGRGSAKAIHSIFASVDGEWKEVLHLEGCLPFSSVKFQSIEGQSGKAVYYDNDFVCDTISTERAYSVFEWDGAQFVVVESGIARKWPFSSLSGQKTVLLLLLVLFSLLAVSLAVLQWYRGTRDKH